MFDYVRRLLVVTVFILLVSCGGSDSADFPAPTQVPASELPTVTASVPIVPTFESTEAPATATTEPDATPEAAAEAEPTNPPEATAIPLTAPTSTDGLTLVSDTPTLARSSSPNWDSKYLYPGPIVKDGGQYHMFYNHFVDAPDVSTWGYAVSDDLVNWERATDDEIFSSVDVPYTNNGAYADAALRLNDGTWVIYFYTFDSRNEPTAIGRALADRPTGPWDVDDEPVLTIGPEGAWDSARVLRPSVTRTSNGFVMLYTGVDENEVARIGRAKSLDGKNWTKYDVPTTFEGPFAESDPILEPTDAWEGNWITTPEYVFSEDEGWILLYENEDNDIGAAFSVDGINWNRSAEFAIQPAAELADLGENIVPFEYFYDDGTSYVYRGIGSIAGGYDIYTWVHDGSLKPKIAVDTFESTVAGNITQVQTEPVVGNFLANKYINPGVIIRQDGVFHMFSNAFDGWPAPSGIYYYQSTDGVEWTKIQRDPIFESADVPYRTVGALALGGLLLEDGTWVLYFHTFERATRPGFIGRATASDPLGPWTIDPDPVLSPGSPGEWDERQVMRPNIFFDGTQYTLYYSGVDRNQNAALGMATSTDGVTFTKYNNPDTTTAPFAESDPLMVGTEEWEGSWIGRPEIVLTENGFVMLYEGNRAGSNNLGLATSEDGINWVRSNENPVFTLEDAPNTHFQGELYYEDGVYSLYLESGPGAIGTDVYLFQFSDPLEK